MYVTRLDSMLIGDKYFSKQRTDDPFINLKKENNTNYENKYDLAFAVGSQLTSNLQNQGWIPRGVDSVQSCPASSNHQWSAHSSHHAQSRQWLITADLLPLAAGMAGLPPKWGRFSLNGANMGLLFQSDFSTFCSVRQNVLKSDVKKSWICPIWGKSSPLCLHCYLAVK